MRDKTPAQGGGPDKRDITQAQGRREDQTRKTIPKRKGGRDRQTIETRPQRRGCRARTETLHPSTRQRKPHMTIENEIFRHRDSNLGHSGEGRVS